MLNLDFSGEIRLFSVCVGVGGAHYILDVASVCLVCEHMCLPRDPSAQKRRRRHSQRSVYGSKCGLASRARPSI